MSSASLIPAVIPFDEIVPGASVRMTVIDGKQYLSIRDIIMYMCDKNNHRAAQTWREIPENQKEEVKKYIISFQFPGKGQSEQPVITFPGAIRLAMFLPGKNSFEP